MAGPAPQGALTRSVVGAAPKATVTRARLPSPPESGDVAWRDDLPGPAAPESPHVHR